MVPPVFSALKADCAGVLLMVEVVFGALPDVEVWVVPLPKAWLRRLLDT